MPKRMTWQQYAAENEYDFEEAYYSRLAGASWENLVSDEISASLMQRLVKDWCKDNNRDYELIRIINPNKLVIIDDIKLADKGKICALRKANWPIKEIAIDCHCTERIVEEVLNGRNI